MSENYEISLKDWKEMEQASCLLLDVRDNMAFQYGHIGDAINLPLEELKEQIEKNELSEQLKQNKKIIVYCKRGEASAEATALLREQGCDAYNLTGGYMAWLLADTERGSDDEKGDTEKDRLADIEQSIRKKFHKQLFSRFARGINDYELVKPGDKIQITEYQSYMNYSYIIEPAVAMSGCYPNSQRIKAKEGTIVSVEKAPLSGYVVIAEFEE